MPFKFKKSLKIKLVAGALGRILIISLAITVVVAAIVNRQNRAAVNRNLESAMAFVRDDLKERAKKTAADLNQMAAATMDDSANKVQIVASAAEELNATISEITQNTTNACDITTDAVDQARSASNQVSQLGHAA